MGLSEKISKSPKKTNVEIKQTCPSFRRGHVPSPSDVKRLRSLALPHVGSFDYFLDRGLSLAISDIIPFEIDLIDIKKTKSGQTNVNKEVQTLKLWIENVRIAKPVKTDQNESSILTPRECRELGLMYSGSMTGDFCYQVNNRKLNEDGTMTEIPGQVNKISKKFGDMPIMVTSKACHLHDKTPEQLVQMKEEVSYLIYRHASFVCLNFLILIFVFVA